MFWVRMDDTSDIHGNKMITSLQLHLECLGKEAVGLRQTHLFLVATSQNVYRAFFASYPLTVSIFRRESQREDKQIVNSVDIGGE